MLNLNSIVGDVFELTGAEMELSYSCSPLC